jgi:hypothetical protein
VTTLQASQKQLIVSYLTLRRTVGVIGTLLPVILIVGKQVLFSGSLPLSVSDYYFTHMRTWLVGSLIVLGVFMLCYAGYDEWDRWITNGAGVFLIGIAFFPESSQVPGDIHVVVSALAFVLLAVMALRFTKTEPGVPPTTRKRSRNVVYRICAFVMLGSLAVEGLFHVILRSVTDTRPADFAFESLAIMAFGISWLVKGRTLLADR